MKLLAFLHSCIFKYLHFLIFTLLLASCTGDKEVRAVLDRAERHLPEYPDSADAELQTLDPLLSPLKGDDKESVFGKSPFKGDLEGLSLYGLLRTMTDAMQGKGVTTDSLIRPSYIYYKERSGTDENLRRLGRSAFYLARFEASRDSTKRAEDLYREAIRCSEQVEDWRTCYMAYDHFANSIKWSNAELAILLRKKSLYIYNRCKDKPSNNVSILNSLSNDYLVAGFADSAFNCAEEAYQLSCDYQLEDMQFASLRALSNLYYETGNYQKALELAKQGMYGLNDKTRDASLFSLADCYLACDSLEQAKTTLLSIHSSDKKKRQVVFEELLQLAHVQKDYDAAMCYADSLEAATIDMFTNIQQTKDEYYQENLKKELYNMQLAQHKRQQAFMLWGAIILIVVISVFVVIIYHKNLKIACQKRVNAILLRRRDRAEHTKAINDQKQSFTERIVHLTDQILELQHRQQKEKMVNVQIQRQLQDMQNLLAEMILKGTTFMQKLDSYSPVPLTDEEWHQLEVIINQKRNNIIANICNDFPKISPFDLRICMLTVLALSNTEIGLVLEHSQSSIKKHKHYIKTAIFGVQDTNIDFESILFELYP